MILYFRFNYDGNRTEWNPVRYVITSMKLKQTELDDTMSSYLLIVAFNLQFPAKVKVSFEK